jgi:Uma2 family endonuclease
MGVGIGHECGAKTMVQALPQHISFEEFIDWYPEKSGHQYELHNGIIIEMPKPRGRHSQIAGFLAIEFGVAIRLSKLPYFIPKECVVQCADDTGYEPDVIVLDERELVHEPYWEKSSVITRRESIKLLVEVVSTNWRDDYLKKLADYEASAVPEYWVVDYAALGGRRFIGDPKQPTISLYTLVEGEFQVAQFKGKEAIVSMALPELQLSTEAVFQIGKDSE